MASKSLCWAMVLACGVLVGCEKEGPAEKAGERIDEAAERTIDAIEDAGKQGPMEKLGERADEQLQKAQDALQNRKEDAQPEGDQ